MASFCFRETAKPAFLCGFARGEEIIGPNNQRSAVQAVQEQPDQADQKT